jgi:hypothetical protein
MKRKAITSTNNKANVANEFDMGKSFVCWRLSIELNVFVFTCRHGR